MPLHNNEMESTIRCYVKVRKISGSTPRRGGPSLPRHVRQPEEDVPEVGAELLVVSAGSDRWLGKIAGLADRIRQKAAEIVVRQGPAASPEAVGGGQAG